MPLTHTLSCLQISSTIFSKRNIIYLWCTVLSNFSLNQFMLCASLRNNFVHHILFIMSDHRLLFCHIEFRFRTTSYHHRNMFLTKQMPLLLTYYSYINFTSYLFQDDSPKYNFVISRRSFLSLFHFLSSGFFNSISWIIIILNISFPLTLFTFGLLYDSYSHFAVFMITSLYVASSFKKPLPNSFPFISVMKRISVFVHTTDFSLIYANGIIKGIS